MKQYSITRVTGHLFVIQMVMKPLVLTRAFALWIMQHLHPLVEE
jgi:hypothetical protein